MSIERPQRVGAPAALGDRCTAPGIPSARADGGSSGSVEAPGPETWSGSVEAPGPETWDADTFHRVLRRATAADAPRGMAARVAAEAVRRLGDGQPHVPDLRLLLLEAPATDVWARARRAALGAVASAPALAPRVISLHAQLLRLPSATVREGHEPGSGPAFVAQAAFPSDGPEVAGSVQRAHTRKGARQQAMASLVAALAGLEDPFAAHAGTWPRPTGTVPPRAPASRPGPALHGVHGPVPVLAEYAQAGHITRPEFHVTAHSPGRFTATVTTTHRGRRLTGTGTGPGHEAARAGAADDLLKVLRHALADTRSNATAAQVPGGAPLSPVPAGPPAPTASASARELPQALAASAPGLFGARAALDRLLAAGAALTLLPSPHPAHTIWMAFRPDGTPLAEAETPTAPLRAVTRELVLAGPGGIMPRRATVTGIAVPLGLALPALLASRDGEHPSVTGWRHAVRLGLECVARRRVHPALTADGQDCWRVGPVTDALRRAAADVAVRLAPEGHCLLAGTTPARVPAPEAAVRDLLDAVADSMLRTPGASVLLGPGPYCGPPEQHVGALQELWKWADAIEDTVDPRPVPGLVLRVKQPDATGDAPAVPVTLHLDAPDGQETVSAIGVWDGHTPRPDLTPALLPGVRRALRRAARVFPPLAGLAVQERPGGTTLSANDLVRLHLHAAGPLADLGVAVHWPAFLVKSLTSTAVVGGHDEGAPTAGGGGCLTLERLVDCRWHIDLDGEPLSDEEMTALAEAVRPLIRLRGRWLLVDPDTARRARDRDLAPLPSLDALAAALSGALAVDGEMLRVRPAGTLAALVEKLRRAPSAPCPVPPPATLKATLRHYQQRALTWLAHTTGMGFGALLADDMGLGKTLTTIALHLHRAETVPDAGPTLVVCPASLMTNWQREIDRFAPGTTVVRYHGTGRALDAGALDHRCVVITTYGTLRRDTRALAALRWGLVVADEAQHAKSPASATAAALRELPARARLAVTGTPVENNLTELWAVLDWTNPGLFGSHTAFRARYAAVEKDARSPAAGRLARLIGPFMMRRHKSDPGIAPELPGKVHHTRVVSLTDEQIGLYEATVRDTMAAIAHSTGIARRGLVLGLLQALRQICDAPALYLKESLDDAADGPADSIRRSGKLAALDELLSTLSGRGEAALIFTGYVRMGRILEHHLRARGHRSVYFLHGQTPPARRQDLVDRFQHDPDPAPLFVLSVKAAGTGLNLTRAEHVVHYDRPWNPAVEDQATDRAYRIGQRRTVQVHHLITEGTVEDHIGELLARKRALTEAVLTSGESALADLDDTELAALVTLQGTR
ncbi:DEAD/DEAH box helicase [Streptomyces sp. NPDC047985]|uniref:DEAD/DEAH box helicase n=1 Tax=Streptomyces sp. NPDC047985 TaxID=3155384 RepID=UPI00342C1304